MIKTLIKLKILKLKLIGGVSTAYVLKKYCDQKPLRDKCEIWFLSLYLIRINSLI